MHLLIPAAGRGTRMGSDRNKLLLPLLDAPILAWTLRAAIACERVRWIGIIGQPYDFEAFRAILARVPSRVPIALIEGGATRQESVWNGLRELPAEAERVSIHDGARCLATPMLFDRLGEVLLTCDGAIAAVPVKDTIKIVDEQQQIRSTPDRRCLWAAQTPQGFSVELLKECHQRALDAGWQVTDDAALLERCEIPVRVVEGEETNLKVTTPVDLAIAEYLLRQRLESDRIG